MATLSVDIEKKLDNFLLKLQFQAENGVLALLGASGCGKSMTLKCIAGIERPDQGRIVLNGKVLFDSEKGICLSPQKRKVGYLFQQYALFPNMTVYQNIRCGVRGKKEADRKTMEMLRMLELSGLERKRPYQLSGGEQQRTALARILVNEPEVLLLDEPFSALDSHLRFSLERRLREVMRSFGKPVLLVSHDRDEVYRLAERIAVMRNGGLEAIGEKHEVFRAPVTVSSARLTGCKNISAIRWLDDTHIVSPAWGIRLRVAAREGKTAGDGKAAYAGVRMHDIHPGEGENTIACQVTDEIENPFSYTIMLKPEEGDAGEPMGMELSKEEWRKYRAAHLKVHIPPKAILLLKE